MAQPALHTLLARQLRRLGLDAEAYAFWETSCSIDLKGGSSQGIHSACCGMNWQVAVFGFGGVASGMNSELLKISPRLPATWISLRFPLVWKSIPVVVDISHTATRLENRGDREIQAQISGELISLSPGESRTVSTLHCQPLHNTKINSATCAKRLTL